MNEPLKPIETPQIKQTGGPVGPPPPKQDVIVCGRVWDDAFKKEVDDFARKLEAGVNKGDMAFLSSHIDKLKIVPATIKNPPFEPSMLVSELESGTKSGMKYVYLHTLLRNDQPEIVFRQSQDTNFSYQKYVLRPDGKGSFLIDDIYMTALGDYAANALAPLVNWPAGDAGVNLTMMIIAYKQKKFKDAEEMYAKLPRNVSNIRILKIFRYMAATGEDERAAQEMLKSMYQDLESSRTSLLLFFDLYLQTREFKLALRMIDSVDQVVGGDPYLNTVREEVKKMQAGIPAKK